MVSYHHQLLKTVDFTPFLSWLYAYVSVANNSIPYKQTYSNFNLKVYSYKLPLILLIICYATEPQRETFHNSTY